MKGDLKSKKPNKKDFTKLALGPQKITTSKSHTNKEMGGTPPPLQRNLKNPKSPSSSSLPNHPRRRRSTPTLRFPEGSIIEINTDEDDFKLVFFAATVISCKKAGKLTVEYRDLLAAEGTSDRLTEEVNISFARPAPPPQEIVADLGPNDVVDAFYKDGWWIGVVARAVDGGDKYVVTFVNPPDKRTLPAADLRVHWDWLDGKWVRPAKKAEIASMSEGEKVEVTRDLIKPHHYSWFEASILKRLEGEAFLVEYCTVKDDKGQPLKAIVSTADVRPCPPVIKEKVFIVKDKVDAYLENGWWTGTIRKVLPGDKYIVFFKHKQSEEELPHSVLRLHMEWANETWSTSSKLSKDKHYISESSSVNHILLTDSSGDKTNVSQGNTTSSFTLKKGLHEKSPPAQKPSEVTLPLAKKRRDLSDSRRTSSRASKRRKEVNVVSASKKRKHDTSEMTSDVVSPVSASNLSSATPYAQGVQSSGNHSQDKKILRKGKELVTPQNRGKVAPKSNSEKSSTPNSQEATADVQNEHVEKPNEISYILSLPCAGKGGSGPSRGTRSSRSHIKELKLVSDQEQQPDVLIKDLKDTSTTPPETEGSSAKKKRGRPPKKQRENLQMPVKALTVNNVEGNAEDGVLNSHGSSTRENDLLRIAEEGLNGTENAIVDEDELVDQLIEEYRDEITSSKNKDDKQFEESSSVKLEGSSKRGSTPTESQNSGPHVENSLNGSRSERVEIITLDPEEDARELPLDEFTDEPLSKWIEHLQSPSMANFSRVSPAPNVVQNTESSRKQEKNAPVLEENHKKQPEAEEQTSISRNESSLEPAVQQSLPFSKTTALWETIENFDIFKRIPQNPHFTPLLGVKECLREGSAIGLMVNFSNIVEKVSSLRFRDPDSVIEEIKHALDNFRLNGFNVRVLEDRLNGLMAVRDKQGHYIDEVNELDRQISLRKNEMRKVEEEISKTAEELKKLQEKLSAAMLAKNAEDGEIMTLQAKMTETKESIANLEREFQSIVSAKLQRA